MNRALKKGPFIKYELLKKKYILKTKKLKLIIKTWSRASVILPCMLQTIFAVYNGKYHIPLIITNQIIGYKLGEFIPTKIFLTHKKKEKKIKYL